VIELPAELRRCLRRSERSPQDAFECFFSWYNDAWLMKDDLWAALDEIPRPLREIVVTHQAWGYMSSEAPNGYYWRFDQRFDDEIRRGLSALGRSECFAALARGRELHRARGEEGLTLEEDHEIYDQLPPLEDMETLIGEYLLAAMGRAK
jgi:hypothetical protein